MVAVDLGDIPFRTARRIPLASWFRFRRAVEHTPTVLLAITQALCAHSCATLSLKCGLRLSVVILRGSFQTSALSFQLLHTRIF